MDIKKQINQLDPKLQATYDRVMGTAMPKQPISAIPAKPATTINKPSVSIFDSLRTRDNSKTFQPITKSSIPQPIKQTKQSASIPQTQTQPEKKKNKLKPLLIIFGGIIFLLGYTLIWIKIFGLKLPFLPF